MLRPRRAAEGGFTVMEAGVAGAVISIFLGSLFALNSNMIHLLRAASEAANASQDLQTRVEQVRLANWTQITDPRWFNTTSFFYKTDALVNLPGMTETITVSASASPSSAPGTAALPAPFTVTHQADDTIKINPAGYADTDALLGQEMIRIDVSVTWPTLYRSRSRSLTTLVSRWGISK